MCKEGIFTNEGLLGSLLETSCESAAFSRPLKEK